MNDIHSYPRWVRYQRTEYSITVREFRSDGWNINEVEVSSYEEYFEKGMEEDRQNWDRNDPEFWDELFAQRPSWERD